MFTLRSVALLATFTLAANAGASTLNQAFTNDYEANAIYFFASDPANLGFGAVSFAGAASGWTVNANTGAELVMSGPTVAPKTGLFTVGMNYVTTPIALEWAEVYFTATGNTLLGAGTLSWNNGWSATDAFTHLAALPASGVVPIPPPAFLLLSACGALPLLRRRSAA